MLACRKMRFGDPVRLLCGRNMRKRNSQRPLTMYISLFGKAENLLALNNPAMMLAIYGCIISVSWFGAKFIVIGTKTFFFCFFDHR